MLRCAQRTVTGWLVVLVASGFTAAQAEDAARFFPESSLLYAGWSAEGTQLDSALHVVDEMIAATRNSPDPEAAGINLVLRFSRALGASTGGVALLDIRVENGTPIPDVVAVIDARDQSDILRAAIDEALGRAGMNAAQTLDIAGVSFHVLPIPETPLRLLIGRTGERHIVSLSPRGAEEVLHRIQNGGDSLLSDEGLHLCREKVGATFDTAYFAMYANVDRIVSRLTALLTEAQVAPQEMLTTTMQELGLNAVHTKYWHIDGKNGRTRSLLFAQAEMSDRGLLSLWNQAPLRDSDLAILPADAYWATVGNLDLTKMWQEVRRVLGVLAPPALGQIEGVQAMTAGMLGFSVTEDLFPALGNTWAFFDARDHGGILGSGTVMVVDAADETALRNILTRIQEVLRPLLLQDEITLAQRQMQHADHTIDYVLAEGAPLPIAPAWAFVDGRMIFGLHPVTVAVALEQVDPARREQSLLDHADLASKRDRMPDKILSLSFQDSRYFARMLYPLGQIFQTIGASQYGMDISTDWIPPVAKTVSEVENYLGCCARDEDGILYAGYGNGQSLVAMASAAAAVTSVALPALSKAREQAKRTVSMAQMRSVGAALHMYAAEHDNAFPPDLDTLLEAGMITEKMLHSPRQSVAEGVHYVYIPGQTTQHDSQNVVAYERIIGSEGTNVLFLDSHVEWVSLPRLRVLLEQTYARLGREPELPPALRD